MNVALSRSAATVTLQHGNQHVVLTLDLPLSGNTVHTLRVNGVRDLAGNAMAAPVVTTAT